MSGECKVVSPSEEKKALAVAQKKILRDDGSHVTSINDIVKLIKEQQKGGSQKGGVDLAKCTTVLAGILCAMTAVGGIMAFSAACNKYGVTLEQLQAAKKALEVSLAGCDTVEGIAARKLAANYSVIPSCSDVTSKIENVAVEIAELMKKAPGTFISAATNSWGAATAAAGTLCAGICYLTKKDGGKKSRKNKKTKRSRKQRRITKKH